MFTFSTLSFICYSIFLIVLSFLIFILLLPKKKKEEKVKSSLKIGGIYGRKRFDGDNNDPFSPIRAYGYYVAIIDVKPSRDGDCEYCQYVFLNDNMSPYSSYSYSMIYSAMVKKFDDWEYIKDIDLNTIKIS